MKKQPHNQEQCDHERLSRFHDGELAPRENDRVNAHIHNCPDCQRKLADFDRLGQMGRRHVDQAVADLDAEALTKHVLARRPKAHRPFSGLRNWFKPSRLFLPVAVTALALAIYIIPQPFRTESKGTAPSAIINSFTGSVTSVMFYETPNTRQTIIWISEDATANGENGAV